MSRSDRDRIEQARGAAHEAQRYMHRRRFGTVGTEPPQGRNPVRQWGSIGLGIIAFIVSFAQIEVGAALTVVSLALGVPRSWTWAGDKVSSLTWAVAAVMLVVGEALYIFGSDAVRRSAGGGHGPGAAAILIAFSNAVAVSGYYRRWGTAGNSAYWQHQRRKGDPDAVAVGEARIKASGRTWDDSDG
jgi:hypothetical protein